MLRIHTVFQNWSKTNIFDLHLNKIYPFGIRVPRIKIANNKVLFEQYIIALNWDKYDTEFRNDDAIKRNQTCFDFMQQMFNRLDGLYLHEICLLIDVITKYHSE